MVVREIGWTDEDWIHLAQGSCEHNNEPSGSVMCCDIVE
jgi:hypothetical protein